MNQELIQKVGITLLKGRTWRYLRYLHFREYLQRVSQEISTVCVCGAGHGMAELALAIEFPNIEFVLTDIVNRELGYPNYHNSMAWAWREGVDNIRYSVWDVLKPTRHRFDLVASTEMLEHIKDDESAARNMVEASNRYVYCVVPYATPEFNADKRRRAGVWERHKHHVVGYDAESLTRLFPAPRWIAGMYWADRGVPLRQKLHEMSDAEIVAQASRLKEEAASDLLDKAPEDPRVVQGIKILSRVA